MSSASANFQQVDRFTRRQKSVQIIWRWTAPAIGQDRSSARVVCGWLESRSRLTPLFMGELSQHHQGLEAERESISQCLAPARYRRHLQLALSDWELVNDWFVFAVFLQTTTCYRVSSSRPFTRVYISLNCYVPNLRIDL